MCIYKRRFGGISINYAQTRTHVIFQRISKKYYQDLFQPLPCLQSYMPNLFHLFLRFIALISILVPDVS